MTRDGVLMTGSCKVVVVSEIAPLQQSEVGNMYCERDEDWLGAGSAVQQPVPAVVDGTGWAEAVFDVGCKHTDDRPAAWPKHIPWPPNAPPFDIPWRRMPPLYFHPKGRNDGLITDEMWTE